MKLNLYKNGKLVLNVEGKLIDNEAVFGNIIYNLDNKTLIRQDASYKYLLDFNNNEAKVELKEYDKELPLKIKTTKIDITNNYHKISYTIESEEEIYNVLEVIF